MKPLRIEMHAFGPFAGEEIVDFRKLGDSNFFLIHGPTGSGKSSILDAMCFALYGETSGDERKGQQMRSHHARTDCETRVVLDFAVGARTYRIERTPQQQRPRQRGDGPLVTVQPKATLWRTDQVSDEVLATKVNEATVAIVKLLGFDADQFRQVVVLPQGQFRRLLSAGSDDRQKILAKLFNTEPFKKIEQALKDQKRALEVKLEANKEKTKGLLDRLGVDKASEVPGVLAEEAQALEILHKEQLELARLATVAQALLEEGRAVGTKLDERKASRAQVEAVEADRERVSQVRQDLQGAHKAQQVEPALRLRDDKQVAVADAGPKVKAAKAREVNARSRADAAKATLANEEARGPERDGVASEVSRLEAMVGDVAALQAARGELDIADKAHQGHMKAFADAEKAVADAEQAREVAEAGLAQASDAVARLDGLDALSRAARKSCEEREILAKLERDHSQISKKLADIRTGIQGLVIRTQQAVVDLQVAEAQWRSGQAALLALGLKDGKPCPVCGATHHPNPAAAGTGDGEAVPGDEVLEQLRDARDKSLAALEQARQRETEHRLRCETLEAKVQEVRTGLGDASKVPIEGLKAQAIVAEKALADAQRLARSVDDRTQAVTRMRADLVLRQERRKSTDEALKGAAGVLQTARARVDERGARVPENLRGEGVLEGAIGAARGRVGALQDALKAAKNAHDLADRALTEATVDLAGTTRALDAATKALAQAQAALDDERVKAGFGDEGALKASRRIQAEMDAMEGDVRRHEQALADARGRLERAEVAAGDLVAPDLTVLGEIAREARQRQKDHDETVGRRNGLFETRRGYALELDELRAGSAAVELQYGIVGRLSEVANGTNQLNLTLERYVLAALLDEVLVAATHRLRVMSQGRYELRRVSYLEDGRRAGGLDLEVLDSHTGMARPVATLSGGEGFMASLSLALGLADVVQSQAGGIHLDAIFVDEGFGSLDGEMLDNAIQTLRDLRANGRLVGIISHVTALRDAIDVRLEVTGGHSGSSTKFVLAEYM